MCARIQVDREDVCGGLQASSRNNQEGCRASWWEQCNSVSACLSLQTCSRTCSKGVDNRSAQAKRRELATRRSQIQFLSKSGQSARVRLSNATLSHQRGG